MNFTDVVQIAVGAIQGLAWSGIFILGLFIGFCVVVGLTKLKKTAGTGMVVKSLDEVVNRQEAVYLTPDAPHGPADQLRSPAIEKQNVNDEKVNVRNVGM
jgi:hypothetical protein